MKTIFAILLCAFLAALIGWGYNEITFRPPENVPPTLTLYTKEEMPKPVIQDILERHGEFIVGVASFDGPSAVSNADFPTYVLFHGSLVALGIGLFIGIQRFTKTSAEQPGTGQPATRPVDEPKGGDKPQPEAEGRSR